MPAILLTARLPPGAATLQQVQVDKDQDAGKIIAFHIKRDMLRCDLRSFHYHMNPVLAGSRCNFAHHLFDRCGMLKQRLHDTFGAETDQGSILYIRNITMKKEYSKQKLACKALKKFLQVVCTDEARAYLDQWWLAGMSAAYAVLYSSSCINSGTRYTTPHIPHKCAMCLQSCTTSRAKTAGDQLVSE